jgi:ubiquinone/menaquinone biosynthesis C-methylase UbiE
VSFRHGHPTARDTQDQYARQAQLYAESSLHRRGESLEAVRQLAAATAADTVLDLGTGVGFTAFTVASDAGRVIAADLTPEMLAQAQGLARERRLEETVEWILAAAERLPLADNSVPVITCRYASHHFHDLARALRELARVIQPGGRVVLCDVIAPEAPGMGELMNEWEQVRDPTHVWDYRLSQWREELLPAAGFQVQDLVRGTNPQLFSEWVHRAGTPGEAVNQLIEMFATTSEEARREFEVRWEGAEIFFSWPNATILATKR